jgi:adenylosuccinate synthase
LAPPTPVDPRSRAPAGCGQGGVRDDVAALAILLIAFIHVAPRRIGCHARRVDEIATAKSVLESVAEWSEPIDGARSMTELPAAARHYVELVEKETGVSVGADREATIVRHNAFA